MKLAPTWPVLLQGPLVLARSLTEADLPTTLEWRNHAQSRKWFKSSDVIDTATHYAWFHNYNEKPREYMFFFESVSSRLPVGQGGIYAVDEANGRAEVGRFVSEPSMRGRGWFREGLILMLQFVRSELALREVSLEVLRTNDRAIRLYRSVGFRDSSSDNLMLQMHLRLEDHPFDRDVHVEGSSHA